MNIYIVIVDDLPPEIYDALAEAKRAFAESIPGEGNISLYQVTKTSDRWGSPVVLDWRADGEK